MPTSALFLFLFAALASGALLLLSFQLKLKSSAPFLELYFYFIIATVCYGLVNWVGPVLISYFAEQRPQSKPVGAILVIIAFALPLAVIRLYLFVMTLLAMVDRPLPSRAVRAFWLVASIVLVLAGFFLVRDGFAGTLQYSAVLARLLGVVIIVLDYVAIGYFLSRVRELEASAWRQCAGMFGWAYLIGYFVYAGTHYLAGWSGNPWYQQSAPYLYYLLHLVPLLVLTRHARGLPSSAGAAGAPVRDIAEVFQHFNISKREQGILELLLVGKNNQEIADQLCISPNTVRNHVYNIYRKMSVKNRVQLLSLCDSYRFH